MATASVFADHHKEVDAASLEKLWESEAVLKVPESVRFDGERRVLYVSNIDGEPWGKDGKGSIGKVGLDGKVIEAEWVTGLNAPKGMALFQNLLIVADLQEIAIIDVLHPAGVPHRISLPEAEGLNDVSTNEAGEIFVTDSKKGDVYRIGTDGSPRKILEELKRLNGVLASDGEVFIASDGGLYRTSEDGGELKLIANGMDGNADGIERVGEGQWLVSCWAGVVYLVSEGKAEKLLDTREEKINSADLGYDPMTKTAYIPTFWKNSITAYRLK